ncbi:MAG TPA: nucleotide exchange factor GrpE, partial [Caldilineaceae bacterium]|nr:nucleotide exchange factor GrpE [Caldilineaceae bacterium]
MSFNNRTYNPYGRRRTMTGAPAGGSHQRPTLDDYQALAQAYQALQAQLEQQKQELAAQQRELNEKQRELTEAQRELAIKSEALQRQSADLKQLEAELVWTKAALQQQDRAAAQEESGEGLTWRERYLRLQTELDALRRRWEQRYALETAEARHNILRDMLPLADHLELALRHAEGLEGEQAAEFVRNITATRQAFLETLRRYGVEPIEAQGQPFDPNLHEAVGQVHDERVAAGTVAQVVQTGYREGDK